MSPVPMVPLDARAIHVVLDAGYISVEAWGNAARFQMQQFWPELDGDVVSLKSAVVKANEWARSIGITLGVNVHLLEAA